MEEGDEKEQSVLEPLIECIQSRYMLLDSSPKYTLFAKGILTLGIVSFC
jgi:hypothetical protein